MKSPTVQEETGCQTKKEWFNEMLIEIRNHDGFILFPPFEGPVDIINVTEVHQELTRMKQTKVPRLDGMPIEAFRARGVFGAVIYVVMLYSCCVTSKVISDNWRQSTITPICEY